jgi:hypothetical protein
MLTIRLASNPSRKKSTNAASIIELRLSHHYIGF